MDDLRRLRALRELADRGTIAAAADALHLTPSAVSQQLAALEREVGQQLVAPDGRSVRLTPTARVVLAHGQALFAQLERMQADLEAHRAGEVGDLRVGAFATAVGGLVVPAVAVLRERAPGLRVLVTEAETDGAFRGLGRDELDLVVAMEAAGVPQEDDPRFARRPLMADVLDAAVRADHPLADSGPIDLRDLAAEPWVAPPVGWSCESVILTGCRATGFTPRIEHRCGDWHAVLAMVQVGLGVALVPRLAGVTPPDDVRLIPLAGDPPVRHLFAACCRGAEEGPAIRALIDALATVAAQRAQHPTAPAPPAARPAAAPAD
jgi:DNA-binding transcriptional LysR family regulator